MRKNTMKTKSGRSDTFSEARKYGHATVEYIGLVSWSIVERSGVAIRDSTLKIAMPVARNVFEPFVSIKSKTETLFEKKKYVSKKIKSIEEKMSQIEERLALLEKYGVRLPEKAIRPEKREIDKETKALLRQIVEANKLLREAA
ncbi:MAG: hypothetical protein JRF30_03290 [Deltaproteobacteria bacterium]|nr:hypothetical protein [Deltaproteobacteria bacterium]MBW2329961.1 hypothetical protein [Deltaproteobacteria bacterium]